MARYGGRGSVLSTGWWCTRYVTPGRPRLYSGAPHTWIIPLDTLSQRQIGFLCSWLGIGRVDNQDLRNRKGIRLRTSGNKDGSSFWRLSSSYLWRTFFRWNTYIDSSDNSGNVFDTFDINFGGTVYVDGAVQMVVVVAPDPFVVPFFLRTTGALRTSTTTTFSHTSYDSTHSENVLWWSRDTEMNQSPREYLPTSFYSWFHS